MTDHPEMHKTLREQMPASPDPADLIAAVRQAIESGTIEGRIIDNRVMAWPGEEGVGDGLFLVIPVSDGGEDRP